MLSDILTVAAVPLEIAVADKESNLAAAEHAIASLDGKVDIVVLPELFSTGYIADHEVLVAVSETISGPTVERLMSWAARYNVAISGTFLARVGGGLYNRAFFIEPSGEETYYDKAHLFGISSEAQMLSRGDKLPPIIRYNGWNISMIVCYDLRFPVWCRNNRNAFDLVIVPANWPVSRQHAWNCILASRAIENQAYYVGADRGGEDQYGVYPDSMTQIYDFGGHAVGQARPDGTVVATLNHGELSAYRRRMPVSHDADTFSITTHQPLRP